jgi:hypothetical protein
MINLVYDITPADIHGVDWPACRLVMELNNQYFLYAVLGAGKDVIALKYYPFSLHTNYPIREQLYEIIKADEVLQKNMNEAFIIYNIAESCLVPEAVYNPELNEPIIELVHGDLQKGLVLNEKVEAQQVYNVFRVPADIHQFFETGFPHGKFWHYFSAWMECLQRRQISERVCVVFYPNILLVAVISGGKFQLMQTLQYQTPEDVAYLILNIYYQFNFSQDDTVLEVGGLVDTDSAVFEELLKYFQHIEKVPVPPGMQLPEGFQSFPEHFFSPLLNIALCVS